MASHTRSADAGRDEHFEAVFAGIAGARDRGLDARDFAGREPVVFHGRKIDAGQRLQHLARDRPLKREQRVARARVHRHGIAGALDVLGDPVEVLHDVRRVHDEHEVRVRQAVGRARRRRTCPAASSARNTAPGRPPGVQASLDVMRWTAASASAPATSISPMWLTSNSPARVRTAMCSSTMPEYSTGMSQPPNSTIRAPRARCRAWSGVFLRVAGRGLCHRTRQGSQPVRRALAGAYPMEGTMRLSQGSRKTPGTNVESSAPRMSANGAVGALQRGEPTAASHSRRSLLDRGGSHRRYSRQRRPSGTGAPPA